MTPPRRLVRFSTTGLPTARRIELWEDHNRDALIGLRCRVLGEQPFDGTELNLRLDRIQLARVHGNSHVVERPAEVIRKNPADAIAVYLAIRGEAFFYHDDGVFTLHPGQALVCDADRPFMRGFSRGLEELAIKVPRATFREVTGLDALHAPLVSEGDVAARTLARLTDRALRLDEADEETMLHLLTSLTGRSPADPGRVHLANARAFIEDHLTDSGLNALRVAAGIGISERHLSRAFASTGKSLPQYVLGRRLERARALLLAAPGTSVAEAATRCGFGSATYFSQAFRAHFGITAADVRRTSPSF
ncbi:helix-turn-helix domain-containing protein [Actinoplanes sp. HUAS TT8]|uniref:helix-turn-helix domain-containing protein n=1 Tax=Actinoplanes sp. HUAS TT8 TaxID=3447453 RepID=UPI003F52010B